MDHGPSLSPPIPLNLAILGVGLKSSRETSRPAVGCLPFPLVRSNLERRQKWIGVWMNSSYLVPKQDTETDKRKAKGVMSSEDETSRNRHLLESPWVCFPFPRSGEVEIRADPYWLVYSLRGLTPRFCSGDHMSARLTKR